MSTVVEDTAAGNAEAAPRPGRPGRAARRGTPLTWHNVCDVADLEAGWGEAARIGSGQIALFRLADGSVHATDQRCPATGAHVMARGIVGGRSTDAGPVATVASPLHKQVYRLDSGECLSAPDLRLAVHPVRIEDGHVWVGVAL